MSESKSQESTASGSESSAPAEGPIKIGIEIEGVGQLDITWKQQPPPVLIKDQQFLSSVKAAKLNRSPSFNTKTGRGMYLSAEESENIVHRPAELVSVPHVFSARALVYLRNSVWKRLQEKDVDEEPDFSFQPGGKIEAPVMEKTVYSPNKHFSKVAGSLQTTIGVSIDKLFAKDEAARERTIACLVGSPIKQDYVLNLTRLAYTASIWSIERTVKLEQVNRLALVYFMAFIEPIVQDLPPGNFGSWEKERLGANFKAQSSFTACGIDINVANDLTQKFAQTGFKSALIAFLRREFDTNRLILSMLQSLDKHLNTIVIGTAGRCMQALHEHGSAFDNFLRGDKLYIVIEAREKRADLNGLMLEVLNFNPDHSGKPKALPPGTTGFNLCLDEATKVALRISELLH